MRRKLLWIVALAAVVAAPVAAAPPRAITQPDWLNKPTGEDMADHYPAAAVALEIEGRAVLACKVNAEGGLVDCRTEAEVPKDLGFGQAALAMASEFRMRPMTVNGEAVDGGSIRIPILFKLPQPEPVTPPPAPRSPEALSQGRRVVDAMQLVDDVVQTYGRRAHEIETTDEGSASGAARAGAAGALRQAVEAHRSDLRDAYARALAAVFSEEEMAAIADFETSYGKLMRDPGLATTQAKVTVESARALRAAGHAAFCAKHDCSSPAALERVWRPADPKNPQIDNPQWDKAPDASDLARAQPEVMGILGVAGAVRLTCRVAAEGVLKDCAVDEEAPAKLGFGGAALKLAASYRLGRIQLAAGGVGRKVTVRIGFPAEELPAGDKSPPARSPRIAALARQIALSSGVDNTARLQTELQIAGYESKRPPGADPVIYDDALAAYRTGATQALEFFLVGVANVWAAQFTDDQLAAFAAFFNSPAGKARQQRNAAFNVAAEQSADAVYRKIAVDAHAIYCGTHDCVVPPRQPASAAKPEPSTRTP